MRTSWHIAKWNRVFTLSYFMVMARLFGSYKNSGWDGEFEYYLYEYKGYQYKICESLRKDNNA